MSQDKQMKAVSPLLQQVINISSIVGGVGTLIFCIWAYQAGVLQSKETLSAFIQQAGVWGPPLFIFLQILQTVVPIEFPWTVRLRPDRPKYRKSRCRLPRR